MEIYHDYPIGIVASFGFSVLFAILHQVSAVLTYIDRRLVRRLAVYKLIRRYRYVGSISFASLLVQMVILSRNILCLTIRANSIAFVGSRAAYLSFVNMSVSIVESRSNAFAEATSIGLRNHKRLQRRRATLH